MSECSYTYDAMAEAMNSKLGQERVKAHTIHEITIAMKEIGLVRDKIISHDQAVVVPVFNLNEVITTSNN